MNLDVLARRLFGRTKDDAWEAGECIRCRLSVEPRGLAPRDRREYFLTALCPVCFDALTPEPEAIQ